jgi:hypothetical protein
MLGFCLVSRYFSLDLLQIFLLFFDDLSNH